jgi:multidrug efflux system membrane fusion protein
MLHPLRFRSLLLLAGLCAVFAGCKRRSSSPPAPVPVRVATVVRQDVPEERAAVGLVQSLHSVVILSRVDGVLDHVHFREGDEVAAGTLLLTLDQQPFLAALRSAEARLAEARATADKADADAERYGKLHAQAAVSDAEFSQYATAAAAARAAVAVEEAAVVTARLNLDYTEIRAPIAGRTSRLALREGSLVRANDASQPLLTINEMAPIGVTFSLPESDLAAVRRAFAAGPVPVRARLTGPGRHRAEGVLDYLDNTVGPTTGTIALRATFPNADHALWPGQFVDVDIRLGEVADALVVPATAIVPGQDGNQIFIVKPDHTIDVRHVQTSLAHGDTVVVTDAVQAGDTVVTDGQLRLVGGTKITIDTGAAAPAAPARRRP